MTTAYSTRIAYGIVTSNIQNLRDLSREDTRTCARMLGQHGAICGCQETIEAEDNEDLDLENPPAKWYHLGRASENDLMVKKSRFRLLEDSELPGKIKNAESVHTLSSGLTGASPHRDAVQGIFGFVENPLFTPAAVVNFHLISGVYKGQKDRLAERVARQDVAVKNLTVQIAWLVSNGCNVIWTADTNWHGGPMPKLHPDQRWLINDGIDKIAFIPSPTANWDLEFVSAEAHANPSDHDLRVANVISVANSRYKGEPVPPKPPVLPPRPLTTPQKIARWQVAHQVTDVALNELLAILGK